MTCFILAGHREQQQQHQYQHSCGGPFVELFVICYFVLTIDAVRVHSSFLFELKVCDITKNPFVFELTDHLQFVSK